MFEKQTAIVFGAGGLGADLAARLATQGANIVLVDNSKEVLDKAAEFLTSLDRPSDKYLCDVTDANAVKTTFANVIAKHGPVQVVINTTGIVGPNNQGIQDIEVENFRKVVEVNLVGSFNVIKQAVTHMRETGYGRIVCYASVAGIDHNPGMSPYSSSKAGLVGLVGSIGRECAAFQKDVTINAVCPVTVMTPMVAAMNPAAVDYMKSKIPAQRLLKESEVTACAAFLASKESSGCNGMAFNITLGRVVGR